MIARIGERAGGNLVFWKMEFTFYCWMYSRNSRPLLWLCSWKWLNSLCRERSAYSCLSFSRGIFPWDRMPASTENKGAGNIFSAAKTPASELRTWILALTPRTSFLSGIWPRPRAAPGIPWRSEFQWERRRPRCSAISDRPFENFWNGPSCRSLPAPSCFLLRSWDPAASAAQMRILNRNVNGS